MRSALMAAAILFRGSSAFTSRGLPFSARIMLRPTIHASSSSSSSPASAFPTPHSGDNDPNSAGKTKKRGRRSRRSKVRKDGIIPWGDGPFAYHDEIEVRIEDLTNMGDGVAKVNVSSAAAAATDGGGDGDGDGGDPRRYVVMVPGVMPGELVRARVWQNRKTHALADLIEVLEPSPRRIEPVCSLFGTCGGCQYQFMPIEDQRAMKRKQVSDVLERIGGFRCDGPSREESEDAKEASLDAEVEGDGTALFVSPVVGSEEVYGYRTKLTPHHDAPDPKTGELGHIGFQAKGKAPGAMKLVDVGTCPIATPEVNDALRDHRVSVRARASEAAAVYRREQADDAVAPHLRRRKPRGATLLLRHALQDKRRSSSDDDIDDDDDDDDEQTGHGEPAAAGGSEDGKEAGKTASSAAATASTFTLPPPQEKDLRAYVATDSNEQVFERVRGLTFKFRAGEFFQNNPFVIPKLIDHVVREAKAPLLVPADRHAAAVPLTGGESSERGGRRQARSLIDAYCGGGLFCLSAAENFDHCAGIEISELNIQSARGNAALNNITNCEFVAGTAENIFATIEKKRAEDTSAFDPACTVVVIDPPRKGCSSEFLAQLAAFAPARVVYVSCDPATQARDAKELVRFGYGVGNVTPFDLFPQTRHIENVMTFDRRVAS